MLAESNAQQEPNLRNLRRSKRRALMRRARREIYATPQGKRGFRVHMLALVVGGALGFGYLAAGPGFDLVPEVVGVVLLATMAGSLVGFIPHWRIASPLIRRRFHELAAEELRKPPAD